MPPICWGAVDTEGSGSGGALPPGRGVGRGVGGGGLVSKQRKIFKGDEEKILKNQNQISEQKRSRLKVDSWPGVKRGAGEHGTEEREGNGTEKSG